MGSFYLISGDDDFAVKARSREAAAALAGGAVEDNSAVEIVPGDSDEWKVEQILGRFLDALRTPPFLCDSKLVWLRHFRDLDKLFAKEPSPAAAACSELLSSPLPPELSVLIDGPGFDGRSGLAKAWKKAGAQVEVLTAGRPNDRKFADTRRLNIREVCEALGKAIDGNAIQFLSEVLGGDSGTLRNELEKLCCYVGDAPRITLADCQAICSRTPETVSWEFTGAIVERNAARALQLLNLLLRQGEAEMRLMATLSGEFQKLIQTRLAVRQLGLTQVTPRTFDAIPEEVRNRYPDNPLLKLHPFRAFKVCENALRSTDAVLARNLELVRNANRALVSGQGEPRMVLEQLVLQLTRS